MASSTDTVPFRGQVLHVIAQLRGAAGQYVVDAAIEQERRAPGAAGVAIGDDAEGAWNSAPALLEALAARGIPVFRCGDIFRRHPAGLRAAATTLATLGLRDNPDVVVHTHTAMATLVARWAGARRLVATCHGWNLSRPAPFDIQDAAALSSADRVMTLSHHWAKMLRERMGLADIDVLSHGLDLSRFPEHASLPTGTRPPRVVSVGELSDRMGPDLLLDAMTRVWQELPAAELHVFGDGDAAEKTRANALYLDPSGARVTFHAANESAFREPGSFDIFVRASRHGEPPMATLEAMLAGLPLVGTDVSDIADLITCSRSGLIVPCNAPRKLAAAMTVLLSTSAEARAELGAAGAAHVRSACGIERHVSDLHARYSHRDRFVPAVVAPLRGIAADSAVRLHLGCGPEHR